MRSKYFIIILGSTSATNIIGSSGGEYCTTLRIIFIIQGILFYFFNINTKNHTPTVYGCMGMIFCFFPLSGSRAASRLRKHTQAQAFMMIKSNNNISLSSDCFMPQLQGLESHWFPFIGILEYLLAIHSPVAKLHQLSAYSITCGNYSAKYNFLQIFLFFCIATHYHHTFIAFSSILQSDIYNILLHSQHGKGLDL